MNRTATSYLRQLPSIDTLAGLRPTTPQTEEPLPLDQTYGIPRRKVPLHGKGGTVSLRESSPLFAGVYPGAIAFPNITKQPPASSCELGTTRKLWARIAMPILSGNRRCYAAQQILPIGAEVNGATARKEGMGGWVVGGKRWPGLSFPSSHARRWGGLAEGLRAPGDVVNLGYPSETRIPQMSRPASQTVAG